LPRVYSGDQQVTSGRVPLWIVGLLVGVAACGLLILFF
jgi:hypothetical protein